MTKRFNVRGLPMILHHRDNFSNTIIRTNDFFEADILDYIRENYPVQKTIIDAGANIGNHTIYFANFLKYDTIQCFEPLADNFNLLRENTRYPNVNIFRLALGDKQETLKMKVKRHNMGACRIIPEGDCEIKAVTLDSFNFNDVTLMKIDVECFEPQLLKGAEKTIERCHPLILIEDFNLEYEKLLPGYVLEKGWPHRSTYLYKWADKPYLIQLYTYTSGCANYDRTLPTVLDSVRPLPIVLRKYRGHLHRWDYMPIDLGNNMCIFTDSADVIFQKPFPKLNPNLIYVANEGVVFAQSPIWRALVRKYPQFESMLDKTIYNVGSFACSGNKMKGWVEYLFKVRGRCQRHSLEQLWFNEWLRLPENIGLITEIPDLFCSMYANIKTGIAVIKNGKVLTSDGIPFTVIHFNGNTKETYKLILENAT